MTKPIFHAILTFLSCLSVISISHGSDKAVCIGKLSSMFYAFLSGTLQIAGDILSHRVSIEYRLLPNEGQSQFLLRLFLTVLIFFCHHLFSDQCGVEASLLEQITCSTTSPLLMTIILSAFSTVLSLCAITITVQPWRFLFKACWT